MKQEKGMRTIMFKLSSLVLLVMLGLSIMATPGYCADCRKGGAVDSFCQNESDDAWTLCCTTYGCSTTAEINYCGQQADNAYAGCVITQGCPSLLD